MVASGIDLWSSVAVLWLCCNNERHRLTPPSFAMDLDDLEALDGLAGPVDEAVAVV